MPTEPIEQPKPKRLRKENAAIIPLPPPVEIRLGSLAISDPKEMIHRAAELASALAEIIHTQKDSDGKPTLYVIIQGRKYVKAEGWTTLGAMMGVVPIEEFCDPLPDNSGYKAKVKLVRMNDQAQVGGASAICKMNEPGWNKDAAPTHSKAITRATGKAFRLSFAWVMKLAGFEPTPAEELFETEGSSEESQNVAKSKIEEALGQKFDTIEQAEAAMAASRAEKKTATKSAFITWPESHNGHKFLLSGKTALFEHGITIKTIEEICGGKWNDRENGWYIGSDYAPFLRKLLLEEVHCPLVEKPLTELTGLLEKSIGDTQRRKGPTPVS